jgi:hypothetical protein
MKFMGRWTIHQDKWLPLLKQWSSMTPEQRADGGLGVKILGRWHDFAARSGVIVVEANDIMAVQRYVGRWNAHMDIELSPVLDDEEAAAGAKQTLADNGA